MAATHGNFDVLKLLHDLLRPHQRLHQQLAPQHPAAQHVLQQVGSYQFSAAPARAAWDARSLALGVNPTRLALHSPLSGRS
jgi:hypothetical protein